jgi:hypothetical protein
VFNPLAEAARPILDELGDPAMARDLLGRGWDPMALVALASRTRPGDPRETLARRLQRAEMWLLLEATFDALPA